jgi:hypothetical protein
MQLKPLRFGGQELDDRIGAFDLSAVSAGEEIAAPSEAGAIGSGGAGVFRFAPDALSSVEALEVRRGFNPHRR